jgi:hypothetical protein
MIFIELILSNFCWVIMSQNSIEFDKNIDCDSMKQRNQFFFWKQFCDFLKEQINLIKLWITIVEQKIKLLHQRNNQSIAQLIAYLKVLKEQWLEFISNNLRVSNLLLVLHEYFRKKIVCKNVNVANRKIVKKIVRQIKIMKTKCHFKTQNKFNHK